MLVPELTFKILDNNKYRKLGWLAGPFSCITNYFLHYFFESTKENYGAAGHHMEVVPFLFISKYDLDSLLK